MSNSDPSRNETTGCMTQSLSSGCMPFIPEDNPNGRIISHLLHVTNDLTKRIELMEDHKTQTIQPASTVSGEDYFAVFDSTAVGGQAVEPTAADEENVDAHVHNSIARDNGQEACSESSTDEEEMKIPEDSYAFIYLCGPKEFGFYFGIFVFLVQILLQLTVLLSSVAPHLDSNGAIADGSSNEIFPADVEPLVRLSQFLSITTYTLFADESLKDIVNAINMFPTTIKHAQEGDRILALLFSVLLRLIQGLGAAVTTFFLIFTSVTTRDVILNFVAINFISALDEVAFYLAKTGYYISRTLKKKAQEAQTRQLPGCIVGRKYPFLRTIVVAVIFIAMMIGAAFINVHQIRGDFLSMDKYFRIQIDGKQNKEYQGCYKAENTPFLSRIDSSRLVYESHNKGSLEKSDGISKFVYCEDNRRWNLFKGKYNDSCDDDQKLLVAYSSETTDFEIRNTIGDTWFSAEGAPLDIKFITTGDSILDDNACSKTLGDGQCDTVFNTAGFDWDEGDCCAATCDHPDCGTINTAFNTTLSYPGFGHPDCKDPNMVSIMVSVDFPGNSPIMTSLECDGIRHLMVSVDTNGYQNETIKVPDGATCKFIVKNEYYNDDLPNYTIDHYYYNSTAQKDTKPIAISSGNMERSDFTLIPRCYLQEVSSYIELETIYTNDKTLQITALKRLVNNKATRYSNCDHPFFRERYALVVLYSSLSTSSEDEIVSTDASKDDELFDLTIFQCSWPYVICGGGHVIGFYQTHPSNLTLTGSIPSEIALLTSLDRLIISKNDLEGTIPSEIGLLSNLEYLFFYDNDLKGTIPSEISLLSNLERLYLSINNLNGTIPYEIGLLSNLGHLYLSNNNLNGTIPSEIGLLSNLERLYLPINNLNGTIPSEIGLLSNLEYLDLYDNDLNGTIPSEIGLLSNLERLHISNNNLNGTIPSEIGLLSKLQYLYLSGNDLNGTIPSEIGLLTNATYLRLQNNNLSGQIPTEIDLLSNLGTLNLLNNNLTYDLDTVCDGLGRTNTKLCMPCSITSCPCCEISHCGYTTPVQNDVSNQKDTNTTSSSLESVQHKITVRLDIHVDRFPEDTSWTFHQHGLNFTGDGRCFSMEEFLQWRLYLDPGDAIFEIRDDYSDGICCNHGDGNYTIVAEYPELEDFVLASGDGKYGSGENKTLFIPTQDMVMNGNFLSSSPSSSTLPSSSPVPS